MKKLITFVLSFMCMLAMTGCSKSTDYDYDIKIVVPAGSSEEFIYSDEEISPNKNKITISSGEGLGDTEVVLKPVEVKEENSYEPTYLTPGMPIEMEAEKEAWFKVGVSVQNPTDKDIIVYVNIQDIKVRTE